MEKINQKEIFFKASRKKSQTYWEYRQIIKSWDLEYDISWASDDVIFLHPMKVDTKSIRIDCDKKTGVFRLMFWVKEV
jgi:hypothetical protein